MNPVRDRFLRYARAQWQRVLTQMDRDPDSPTFGCFDRYYWHYKIHDFPSALLQQGVFTLEALRTGVLGEAPPAGCLESWCVAAVNALARQANRNGGVDEHYPFENSYPSAAFGLHAAASVLTCWQTAAPDLLARIDWSGLERLARHLASRAESQAANQQAAGLAALALASRFPRLNVAQDVVLRLAKCFFGAQREEGWFEEYGGPDFGYLSVTLDALADYFDATGDERAEKASDRAIAFLASLVGCDGQLPWTLNSRNTDYVVPYGLARRAAANPVASWLLHLLFGQVDDAGQHFLWATDDRYHLHYIYASVVRAIPHLDNVLPPAAPEQPHLLWLPGCGYWVRREAHWTLYVGANKGGLVRLHRDGHRLALADHGWRMRRGARLWSTNWWTPERRAEVTDASIRIAGRAQRMAYLLSSPLKHGVLRLASWLLRERLIPLLKRFMIFRPGGPRGPAYLRLVELTGRGVRITDHLRRAPGVKARRSPRRNLRHVASADSFSREDWLQEESEETFALDEDLTVSVEWPLHY